MIFLGPPTPLRSSKNCRREATCTPWLPRAVFLSSSSSTFTSWLVGGASSSLSMRALTKSSWFPGNTPRWSPGRYCSPWCPLVCRRRKIVRRLQEEEEKQGKVFWGILQGVAEPWLRSCWCTGQCWWHGGGHVTKVTAGRRDTAAHPDSPSGTFI